MGEIAAANIILALLAPKTTGQEAGKSDATAEKRKHKEKELLDRIDLTVLEEWSQSEQKEAWELITEYASIFPMRDMDLGRHP